MRLNRSVVLAALIALGAAGWVLSGQLRDQPVTAAESNRTDPRPGPSRVRGVTSEGGNHVPEVGTTRQTEALRSVEIRAGVQGRVYPVGARRGGSNVGELGWKCIYSGDMW